MTSEITGAVESNALELLNINFKYSSVEVLKNISFNIPYGSRCLLVGDNGAGKSTLLKLLGGRHMVPSGKGTIKVLGKDSYFDTSLNSRRAFLGGDWGRQIVPFAGVTAMTADIAVEDMLKTRQKKYQDRRDELMTLLQIDPKWRMSQVSDGQRRRVQIMLNLLQPVDLMLLDEVTTDLDVVTRMDFMAYLQKECATRGTTIVYATHIFDGMDRWPTHIAYLTAGNLSFFGPMTEFHSVLDTSDKVPATIVPAHNPYFASKLMTILSLWIRRDRRANLDKQREHDTLR
jgi:CCR4-NOT complex subunit CAF16